MDTYFRTKNTQPPKRSVPTIFFMKKISGIFIIAAMIGTQTGRSQPAVVTPQVSISQEILLKQGTINGGGTA